MNTCKTLYYSFIYPYLIYCNQVWGCATKTALKRIVTLQKKVLRIICFAPFNSHTERLFKELSILRFQDIYTYLVAIFMRKIVTGEALLNYKGMFVYNFEITSRVTRNSFNFHVPFTKTELSKRCIKYTGCLIWNKISKYIDRPMSQESFKHFMKTLLIKEPFVIFE